MQHIDALPCLGLGASLSLSSKPDPVDIVNHPQGPDFVEYAGLVDVARILPEVQRIKATGTPVLYHPSYMNFCGTFTNSAQWLETSRAHIEQVQSAWFAQDCAYCFWGESQSYSSQLGYFIPPILNEASLELAIKRVQEVSSAIPVPLAIEPPPVSFVVGQMPVLTFFGRLAEATNCAVLLDVGHLVSYDMALKMTSDKSILDQVDDFPFERVIEVHIAGGKIKQSEQGPIYIDAHENAIQQPARDKLNDILPLLPNLKALCYECEGAEAESVITILDKLRTVIAEHSVNDAFISAVSGEVTA